MIGVVVVVGVVDGVVEEVVVVVVGMVVGGVVEVVVEVVVGVGVGVSRVVLGSSKLDEGSSDIVEVVSFGALWSFFRGSVIIEYEWSGTPNSLQLHHVVVKKKSTLQDSCGLKLWARFKKS